MTRRFLSALFTVATLALFAQQNPIIPCYSDEVLEDQIAKNSERATLKAQTEDLIAKEIENMQNQPETEQVVHRIPVVVHVVYYNEYDNISDAQVHDAIAVLNEDFRKLNSNANNFRQNLFGNVQADVEVEFVLAKIDPNGNCTNGITRTQSEISLNARNDVKNLIAWPNNRYLNIWTVRNIRPFGSTQGTILGYAAFPYAGQPTTDDGIVMRHDRMGRIGTSSSLGRTLTHEAGHYLNLYHTFQGGCTGNGDFCEDTPPAAGPNYGCPLTANTCSNDSRQDMVENYMDYTNGSCQNTFTLNQKSRCKAVLNQPLLRGDVSSSANLVATGVTGTVACLPKSDFRIANPYVCTGDEIELISTAAGGNNPNFTWDFGGGTQVGGSPQNPRIAFSSPGRFTVKLTVSNNSGSDTKERIEEIVVRPPWPAITGGFSEGFESGNLPINRWFVIDDSDGITWEVTDKAARDGNYSLYIRNNDNPASNGLDRVISNTIQGNWYSNYNLSFNYAYAKRENPNNDLLRVMISNDCGKTWSVARILSSNFLRTAGNQLNEFIPQNQSEWGEVNVDISNLVNNGAFMVMFELQSGGGNNVYIDNINLNGTIGIEEHKNPLGAKIFPNPASESVTLTWSGFGNQKADIKVTDMTGRTVYHLPEAGSDFSNEHSIELPVSQLQSGVYQVEIISGEMRSVHKLVVQ